MASNIEPQPAPSTEHGPIFALESPIPYGDPLWSLDANARAPFINAGLVTAQQIVGIGEANAMRLLTSAPSTGPKAKADLAVWLRDQLGGVGHLSSLSLDVRAEAEVVMRKIREDIAEAVRRRIGAQKSIR